MKKTLLLKPESPLQKLINLISRHFFEPGTRQNYFQTILVYKLSKIKVISAYVWNKSSAKIRNTLQVIIVDPQVVNNKLHRL